MLRAVRTVPLGRLRQLWAALAACLLWAVPVRESSAAPLDPFAQTFAEQHDVSAAWRVQRGAVVLAEGGRGVAGGGGPITADTPIWIGSNSKQFAAAAVLRLVDQGRLELAAPLPRHFPELEPEAVSRGGITCTVEHVLSHRCGLARDPSSIARVADHLSDPGDEASLIAEVNGARLQSDPGSEYAYSNLGYALMGLLVQRASGQSYEQFLRQQFWEPLGMTHTGIRPRPGMLIAPGETGAIFTWVDAASWLFLDPQAFHGLGAAGNIYSSARDLATWTHALHHGQVLSAASWAEMTRPRLKDYGLGLQITQSPIGKLIHHDGVLLPYGYSSQAAYLPAHDLSAVVISNRPPAAGRSLPLLSALLRKASDQPENPPTAPSWRLRLIDSTGVLENVLLISFTLWMLARRVLRPELLDRHNWWLSYHIHAVLLGGVLTAYKSSPLDPWLIAWGLALLAGLYQSRCWRLPKWQRGTGLRPYRGIVLRSLVLLLLLSFSMPQFLLAFAALCAAEAGVWWMGQRRAAGATGATGVASPPAAS